MGRDSKILPIRYNGPMESKYKRTYIKEWRNKRGLSLRALAARMEAKDGEELISHASIGRIEKGQQAYTQPILEALSHALNVSVIELIENDPNTDGEVIDFLKTLSESQKQMALKMLKSINS